MLSVPIENVSCLTCQAYDDKLLQPRIIREKYRKINGTPLQQIFLDQTIRN
ncbi:hypothetical protein WN55_09460 [Dufourea novaeangliae]|uniref:Uncharacterized protein n=1 Tax=Dufourea novaeangliae TaxID=178035 RepID=A0A154PT56_DUFNO|nr:hypothetical protein WN55_09460 [Dufourea novaeangliae]